ncbi:MAG TPA: DNA polymerase III subunit delta [Armatimonadota bacterium]|nr:DNA polymerase III subunit delta [Armatimonadota bacterium]
MAKTKSDDARDVHLFQGEVDPRREAALHELVTQALDADFGVFDLEKFDGISAAAERIIGSVATAPVGSMKKVVIVDRVDRLSAEDQARIAGFIPNLPSRSRLILLASEESSSRRKSSRTRREKSLIQEDADQQKRKKGLRPELVAAVKAHGKVVSFGKLKSEGLRRLAQDAVRRHGKKIEPSALMALVRSVEANPAVIEREVEKLAVYTADRDTIRAADVSEVVCRSLDDRVFPLIDAIAARRADLAVRLLDETFSASAKPDDEVPRILALLGRHFRLLYQAKFLRTQRVRNPGSVPEELQAMLTQEHNPLYMVDWQRRKVFEQADLFSIDELRKCLKQVLARELVTKGLGERGSSPRLNLEMLVLRLSQPKRKPRA